MRVQLLEREPLGVQREQREHLGLAAVEQQPLAVEPGLGGAEQRHHQAGLARSSSDSARGWWAERGIADSISRAITRAVASPIGWVRSQVVERSMTPSLAPVTGS